MEGRMFFKDGAVVVARNALEKFPSIDALKSYSPDRRAAVILTLLFKDGMVDKEGLLKKTLAEAIHALFPDLTKTTATQLSRGVNGTLNEMGLKKTTGRGKTAKTTLTVPRELQDLVEGQEREERLRRSSSRVATATLHRATSAEGALADAPAIPPLPAEDSAAESPSGGASSASDSRAAALERLQAKRQEANAPLDTASELIDRLGPEGARQVAQLILEVTQD